MSDGFFFKILSHNDTGKAAGHQGGIVIPKDLAVFFPPVTKGAGPTYDVRLTARLYVDGRYLGTVQTRYQHQTWGGTRSPERRLTDNLGPLRKVASEGDILLFRKNLDEDSEIELLLVTKSSPEYTAVLRLTASNRWGILDKSNPPLKQEELELADRDQEALLSAPATVFSVFRRFDISSVKRRARDRAFRRKVVESYGGKCAFTARRFEVPHIGQLGLDAAHIVPVNSGGSDDPANGLALTKDIHWAFDRGMLGVHASRRVSVPKSVQVLAGNEFLRDLHGLQIIEAASNRLQALDEAFEWHRENVLLKE